MRLAVLAGTMAALALAGTAASASAASTSCNAGGSIKLSPGITSEPQVQNVTVKGTLAGCESNESRVKSGKFVAHFETAEAIGCEALSDGGVGAGSEGDSVALKTKPGKNSQGTFSVNVTEGSDELLSGLVETGPFAGGSISGSITETFTGSHHCGERKNGKPVKKGTFVGTLAVS
ncbi:MAG TPA: hypothetical protein VMB91_07790 [Solirubrobacteraceae bacterium]|nr:hypothetical protein [Solirubrobacteraceae bacterium]